jgi:hypothetical protein
MCLCTQAFNSTLAEIGVLATPHAAEYARPLFSIPGATIRRGGANWRGVAPSRQAIGRLSSLMNMTTSMQRYSCSLSPAWRGRSGKSQNLAVNNCLGYVGATVATVGQHLSQSCLCCGAITSPRCITSAGPGQSGAGYGWGFFLLRLSISGRAVPISAAGTNAVSRR